MKNKELLENIVEDIDLEDGNFEVDLWWYLDDLMDS